MAGDWIKMRWNLARDPAVIGISSDTGLDEFAVVGRLHHLWSWFNQQTKKGHAPNVTEAWIDRYLMCNGFARAMQKQLWLLVHESNGLSIPKFNRHNSKSAKRRALHQQRLCAKRALSKRTESAPEKRREEKSISNNNNKRAAFAVPTVEEVHAYCESRKNQIVAQQFLDYYEANGWKVGRNPMKNWQAAVRTWEKNHRDHPAPSVLSVRRAYETPAQILERIAKEKEQCQ